MAVRTRGWPSFRERIWMVVDVVDDLAICAAVSMGVLGPLLADLHGFSQGRAFRFDTRYVLRYSPGRVKPLAVRRQMG